MLRHAREGPASCRTREAASIFPPGSDSTEVQTNNVKGNLFFQGNTPAAQANPNDGGQPNIVGSNKIGQCAGL